MTRRPPSTRVGAVSASVLRPVNRRTNPVEERALRAVGAEAPPDPDKKRRWRFLTWLLGRVLALTLLWGSAFIVYDSASSDRFQVQSVQVAGNRLVSKADIAQIAGVTGANLFWVNSADVEARLRGIPAVHHVSVQPVLPDTVEIHVQERVPVSVWASGGGRYLVDREGIVLAEANEAVEARLPAVEQMAGPSLTPGARVDARAVDVARRVAAELPRAGVEPAALEWTHESGLEVLTKDGWRVRFTGNEDLQRQVSAFLTVQDHLRQTKRVAALIDVRFADRPYYR